MSIHDSLRAIAEHIQNNDDFLLIAHTSPDGDTLGCVLALCEAMRGMGKRVQVVCEQTVPRIYRFLPGSQRVLLPQQARPAPHTVALDCADAERMGAARALFEAAQTACNIDHHMTNRAYAGLNAVDGDAAAAGELVYELIGLLPWSMNANAASCLYCALMTDTGNFAYANTTPHTFRTAAELLELGADNTNINRAVYRTVPLSKQRLLGTALTNAIYLANGAVGVTHITLEELARAGAKGEDIEGVIDHIRDVEGVEAAILIREEQHGVYKVSLRSKRTADVGAIAAAFGGGGHKQAAGFTARGNYGEVFTSVTELAQKAVEA